LRRLSASPTERDVERAPHGELPRGDDLAQRLSRDELEDEEERLVLELTKIGGGRDVRVVDA
jgi:hypothetical protein